MLLLLRCSVFPDSATSRTTAHSASVHGILNTEVACHVLLGVLPKPSLSHTVTCDSLYHWTTREARRCNILNLFSKILITVIFNCRPIFLMNICNKVLQKFLTNIIQQCTKRTKHREVGFIPIIEGCFHIRKKNLFTMLHIWSSQKMERKGEKLFLIIKPKFL